MTKELVLMSHDGGVDDYLSVILLMTMDHRQVIGVSVTPADCYIKPAVSATRKILELMGRSDVPVAESTVRGVNPFPRIFRRDAFSVDHFPILNEHPEIRTPLASCARLRNLSPSSKQGHSPPSPRRSIWIRASSPKSSASSGWAARSTRR